MKALLVLWLFVPTVVFAQNQELHVLVHNIAFGGLTAGVGAVVNKQEGENWKKSFARGLWQGSIGGALNYSAKKSLYLVVEKQDLAYALPARLLSSAGNSIIQNAALNGPFLKAWNLEYGLLRFDYSVASQPRFKVRVLPVSVVSTAMALPKGQPDLKATLLTGMMTFQSKKLINTPRGHQDGVNYGRAFVYYGDTLKYHIMVHEVIHEYQYRDFLVFNSFLTKEVAKVKAPGLKKVFTKYLYPDFPYYGLFYMMEGVEPRPRYFRNYFEFEAERFSTNKHVHVE